MGILTYFDNSYTVDHAVKGADFIHGYDENAVLIVSFEGIRDFSGFTYDGTYLEPADYLDEGCNDVKVHGGSLKKADGTVLSPADFGAAEEGHTHDDRYYTETEMETKMAEKAPAYTYGTTDLTAGSSALATGTLHFVYE